MRKVAMPLEGQYVVGEVLDRRADAADAQLRVFPPKHLLKIYID